MVFFKCLTCDKTWSKLIDDGCPICDSPCLLIADLPASEQLPRREPATYKRITTHESEGESTLRTYNDAHIPPDFQNNVRSVFTIFDEGASLGQSDVDLDSIRGDGHEDECSETTFLPNASDSDQDHDSVSLYKVSDDEAQPYEVREAQYSTSLMLLETNHGITPIQEGKLTQQLNPSTGYAQTTDVSLKQDSNSKTIEAAVVIPKGKMKKMKKNHNRQKKTRKPAATPAKFVAQLEMPDPIPEPGEKNVNEGWNKVVRKGAAKGFMELHRHTPSSARTGKFVNATAYDNRRGDENEGPVQDHSTVDVRFGMGSAKHDVRRIIPRSALE